MDELLTVKEAAERLKLKPKTLYWKIGRGDVPVRRFGRTVRVPASALQPETDSTEQSPSQE